MEKKFDSVKCSGCSTCAIACSLHWHNKINPHFATIKVSRQNNENEDINIVTFCDECGACAEVCPVSCITKDDKGILIVNKDECIKCGACAEVCPKDIIIELDEQYAKCDDCGQCVSHCYTGALTYIEQEMK